MQFDTEAFKDEIDQKLNETKDEIELQIKNFGLL